jgi:hypothetical protein
VLPLEPPVLLLTRAIVEDDGGNYETDVMGRDMMFVASMIRSVPT